MIHSSWVWVAWVLRTRSGMATLSDAMAADTAPRAMQTTAVTIDRFSGLGDPEYAGHDHLSLSKEYSVFITGSGPDCQDGIFVLFVVL